MASPTPHSVRCEDFASFMRAYEDMVFTTAARLLGDDRQAQDIAQEAFLKAYEHFDHLRSNPAAGGWLKTVTRNLALNHLMRYRRRWRFFSELRSEAQQEDEPDIEFALPDDLPAEVDAGLRRGLIEEALRQLPQQQRLPLVLYHFEDMSYEAIAVELRVSLAKIKTDIFRARAALAKVLLRSGLDAQTALS